MDSKTNYCNYLKFVCNTDTQVDECPTQKP